MIEFFRQFWSGTLPSQAPRQNGCERPRTSDPDEKPIYSSVFSSQVSARRSWRWLVAFLVYVFALLALGGAVGQAVFDTPALVNPVVHRTSGYASLFLFIALIGVVPLRRLLLQRIPAYITARRFGLGIGALWWVIFCVYLNSDRQMKEEIRQEHIVAEQAAEQKAQDKAKRQHISSVSLGLFQPKMTVEEGVGRFQTTVNEYADPELAGWQIAQQVYTAAHKRSQLTSIVVTCQLLTGSDLRDHYGKKLPKPYIMGEFTVTDLAEIRKYSNGDAYASSNDSWFAGKIRQLDYAYLMRGK